VPEKTYDHCAYNERIHHEYGLTGKQDIGKIAESIRYQSDRDIPDRASKWLRVIKKPTKAIDASSKASSSNTNHISPVTDIFFGP